MRILANESFAAFPTGSTALLYNMYPSMLVFRRVAKTHARARLTRNEQAGQMQYTHTHTHTHTHIHLRCSRNIGKSKSKMSSGPLHIM